MPQSFDLQAKKQPSQARSKATFKALVEACTLILPKRGYAGTSTNHIAETAGVGIASLYEYFPGKDAIIALAIEEMNKRILNELAQTALALSKTPKEKIMKQWLYGIYHCLKKEQDFLRVTLLEVPFSEHINQEQGLAQQLIHFSELLEQGAANVLPKKTK